MAECCVAACAVRHLTNQCSCWQCAGDHSCVHQRGQQGQWPALRDYQERCLVRLRCTVDLCLVFVGRVCRQDDVPPTPSKEEVRWSLGRGIVRVVSCCSEDSPSGKLPTSMCRSSGLTCRDVLVCGVLQTIDDSLRQVFQFFAAYGDRQNKHTLSDFKFLKLLKHAEVTNDRLTEKHIDLIFKTVMASSKRGLGRKYAACACLRGNPAATAATSAAADSIVNERFVVCYRQDELRGLHCRAGRNRQQEVRLCSDDHRFLPEADRGGV